MSNNLRDRQFQSYLKEPPLKRSGFDQQLKQRIEDRLDKKPKQSRSKWLLATVCVCITSLGIMANVFWGSLFQSNMDHPQIMSESESQQTRSSSAGIASPDYDLHSALLIGFRSANEPLLESPNPEISPLETYQYRSLLIAENTEGQLDVHAESDGLIVPYGQQFWKIDSPIFQTDSGGILQYVIAQPADSPDEQTGTDDDIKKLGTVQLTERILFAGNQYISIEKTIIDTMNPDDVLVQDQQLGVGVLDQFDENRSVMSEMDSISIQEAIMSTFNKAENTLLWPQEWGILRGQGRWTPVMLPDASTTNQTTANEEEMQSLQEVSLTLSENVVSYDELCCEWQDVLQIEPDAIDALSSPAEDMIVILTEDEFTVYPLMDDKILSNSLLTVPMEEGEQLVMSQWAIEQYVPIWIEKLTQQLTNEAK